MKIIGIETSCDETAAAVVEDGIKVLSSVVSSSEEIHQKYGGIVPEQAAREQIKSIVPVLNETMRQWNNNRAMKNIDAIAVTVGPGLIGSLLVGIETAKTLSLVWNKPIVPINHLVAHIYANFIQINKTGDAPWGTPKKRPYVGFLGGKGVAGPVLNRLSFPALCLIVSGGHTELVLMRNHGKFKWIGGTRDDAAGECFDKCSRLLQLGYPGGPAIEKAARKITSSTIKLPRPMINENNFDFSFSGLKTAVLHLTKKLKNQQSIAFEIQEAITDVLVEKTLEATKEYKVKSILIGGGVAANQRLREKFKFAIRKFDNWKVKLFIPNKKLCTDNAAIIASTAFFNYQPIHWSKIKPNPSLEIEN